MDLIDDDKFASLCAQEGISVGQAPSIDGAFEVQIERRSTVVRGNRFRECRLPNLARSEQDDAGHFEKPGGDLVP
jgi:hypothetical protein